MLTATNTAASPLPSSALTSAALKVLLYYDLFRYPLTSKEILNHSREQGYTEQQLNECLHALCSDGKIFHYEGFYLMKNDPQLITRRKKGNDIALRMKNKAASVAEFIAAFPYVRAVCVSGSLSKNYFDETTDIDFFIITAPGRLWLCRSLLILYKKIFLLNSKKYFCVNYFIDSNNLEIPDRNIFTATEIVTLLPFHNYELYEDFFAANEWIKEFYPNSSMATKPTGTERKRSVKKLLERIFNTPLGESLDRTFYKATVRYWKKKFPGFNEEEFEVNMRSRKDVSKHHPQGFQFRVLKMYEESCRIYEEQHGISLR